ncbi:hypothetical protein GCM10010973_11950 [Cribrihabitans marinus]|nr:hypothetical protein GCM10010973_11950 [Cribrihabitans marinus]
MREAYVSEMIMSKVSVFPLGSAPLVMTTASTGRRAAGPPDLTETVARMVRLLPGQGWLEADRAAGSAPAF